MVAPLTSSADLRYQTAAVTRPAPEPRSDTDLVLILARGDNEALGQLYDRCAGVLYAIGLRLLGNAPEAEEVLHEVFVEAWKQAPTYDPARGSVRAWLTTRMRSRCLDRCKSAGRSRAVALDDAPELAVPGEDPALARDRARVRAAMEQLGPEQREVIELGYFDGLSSSEMAERLGIPIGTVKSRVAAALGKLRVAMRGAA